MQPVFISGDIILLKEDSPLVSQNGSQFGAVAVSSWWISCALPKGCHGSGAVLGAPPWSHLTSDCSVTGVLTLIAWLGCGSHKCLYSLFTVWLSSPLCGDALRLCDCHLTSFFHLLHPCMLPARLGYYRGDFHTLSPFKFRSWLLLRRTILIFLLALCVHVCIWRYKGSMPLLPWVLDPVLTALLTSFHSVLSGSDTALLSSF